jgi:isochorismate synthase
LCLHLLIISKKQSYSQKKLQNLFWKTFFFDTIDFKESEFSANEKSKEHHIKLVDKTIEEIINNNLKKVVISRKEALEITDFDLIKIYKKLLQSYKNAFVYVWFHPKVGLWLGATPETLLNIEKNIFKTMSLAGTQVYKNTQNVTWKSKELEEQQLVTDFIESQLTGISSNLKIDKKETIKAGNLLHLCNKVAGELNENSTLKTLIRALHPTPAVCGLPRENAKKFILENEQYNRSFYTGFLGELNFQKNKTAPKSSSLFVNLRCMNIIENNASIFVGGGITKDSNAKKEWEETVSKSKVMKCVL